MLQLDGIRFSTELDSAWAVASGSMVLPFRGHAAHRPERAAGMLFPRRVDFRIVGRIDESISQFRKAQASYRKR